MKSSNLFTAFSAAQTSVIHPEHPVEPVAKLPPPSPDVPTHESMLLKALRNSATGCDQTLQGRIALLSERENDLR